MAGRRNAAVAASFGVQGAVLACWASPSLLRGCLLIAVFTLLALWHLRQGAPRPTAAVFMAALGGAGMAVGSWADHAFSTPQCLCCIYDGSQSLLTVWRQTLTSLSVGLMLLVPLLWQLYEKKARRHRAKLPAGPMLRESLGMVAGMGLSGWLASDLVRHLHGWKLEAGFALMLLGMMAGCAAGSIQARAKKVAH